MSGGVAAVLAAGLVLSWALTGRIRAFALSHAIVDVPNGRSSHAEPTPRGGGAAIVLLVLLGVAGAAWGGLIPAHEAIALAGGGFVVAVAGWADDRRSLSARVRLGCHLAAAAWAVYWLGGVESIAVGEGRALLGWPGSMLAVLGIVWATNLYNFMDGIDGLAAGQALCAGAAGGALLALSQGGGLAAVAFLAAAASAGFLAWNWAPAKIFMGDVGSGFLGFLFAALAVASENRGSVPLLVWLVLLGVFVVDGTFTLLRRAAAREVVYQAHREHAYQRLVQAGLTHGQVSALVIGINLALAALGAAAVLRPALLLPVVLTALLGLTAAYLLVERVRPVQREA